MLEQKDIKNNVIDELDNIDDIEDKVAAKNEEALVEDAISENFNVYKDVKPNFIDTFKANIIDLVVIGGISAVGVFVADAVLKLAGYTITEKFQMSFIIFMIVMVLYMSIMESGKNSTTIGKKVSGLIITKG